MSSKHSSSSRTLATPQTPGSKLPKFLQKQNRDRSKSMTDPTAGSTASLASSSSASSSSTPTPLPDQPQQQQVRHKAKSSKLGGVKEREEGASSGSSKFSLSPAPSSPSSRPSHLHPQPQQPQPLSQLSADTSVDSVDSVDEPPVIIEPPTVPRARTRSERPISTVSDIHPSVSLYASNSSTSRISDFPTRLSGWFSHTFSSSSTDLSLPSLLSQQSHLSAGSSQGGGSPKGKGSALLTAAKHGKGHLDKAVRYLLDSDATPDRCTDPIWLLGVQHTGYEPPPPPSSSASSMTPTPSGRRSSVDSLARRASSFRSSSSSSSNTAAAPELSRSQPSPGARNPSTHWPPAFYADFTSRLWLTYRSQFQPIRDSTLTALESELAEYSSFPPSSSPPPKRWNWPIGGEKGWTSDAGWGCMLRTGQSLLANALVHMHLGREWRRPPHPVHTADYAMYIQIITWFLDTPSPQAPFSVHRMALAGKELGKDVGQWFGPSTAAGAIKTLVHSFPDAALGVSVASDGVVYQNDVYAASHDGDPAIVGSPRRRPADWGGRAVLVLVGIRLGLDGVNPVYYNTIKTLYTFPQSVGIAGGRPSSSYYFVGSQADNLFYLDPHHARPAVPLRPTPSPLPTPRRWERETTPEYARPRSPPPVHHRSPTSPSSSTRTGSSTFSYHAPLSPSPLQQQFSTSSAQSGSSGSSHAPWTSASSPGVSSELDPRELGLVTSELDAVQEHFVTAYSAAELRTFHCDRVRKMPLSGLDPSMLIGFLCKDEADWRDFRKRVVALSLNHKTIFTIQDEPPSWPSDSDDNMGLESISEPDDLDMDMPEDEDEEQDGENENENENEHFFDTRSPSTSPDTSVKGKGSEVDTEEDPMGPITPGPNSRTTFDVEEARTTGKGEQQESVDEFGEDDDDDWVDPAMPTPIAQPIAATKSKSNGSSGKKGTKGKKSGVPVVKAPTPPEQHYPFPVTHDSPPPSRQSSSPERRSTSPEGKPAGKRMHTARARDGGRTQSGGVKGVLTADDWET